MGLSSFEKRLLGTLALFGVLQGLVFTAFVLFWNLSVARLVWFIPAHVAYHAVIWILLWSIRKDFSALDGTPLTRIGIPNLLTLFRVTSVPVMIMLFFLARKRPEFSVALVIYITLTFLTDLLDGYLARSFRWGTHLGRILDSSTDYLLIFCLTLILGLTGVLPPWLFVLIILRLAFQVGGLALRALQKKPRLVDTTFLGKVSLFALMVLYAFEILVFLRFRLELLNSPLVFWLEYVVAAILVISIVDKALFFFRNREVKE